MSIYQELGNLNFTSFCASPDVSGYEFDFDNSRFLVVSSIPTRKLLVGPEIIGISIKTLLEQPTSQMLSYIFRELPPVRVNILTILRGGLNFPIEDCCHNINQSVDAIDFITSERIFTNNIVSRIETNYSKITSINESTLIIGDIIASGDTLANALDHVIGTYLRTNKSIRNIIIFTIGTVHTLRVITKYNRLIKNVCPSFKGFTCVFYEGIFTTYPDCGITKLNLPDVDFSIREGFIAPEYRRDLLNSNTAIFEKCAIYDGGARRFEMRDHIICITNYWRSLCELREFDTQLIIKEKLGYVHELSFDEWVERNNYQSISKSHDLNLIYINEISKIKRLNSIGMYNISISRYNYLRNYYAYYLCERGLADEQTT